MSLTEWIITFVKHKDMLKHQLQSIAEKDGMVHAVFKDSKVQDYFVLEKHADATTLMHVLDAAKKSDADLNYSVHVVWYNTQANLKALITHWQQCASHQRLHFYFVNPKSSTDIKWIINPWLHNRISDSSHLEVGLKSMFSMVEEWKG